MAHDDAAAEVGVWGGWGWPSRMSFGGAKTQKVVENAENMRYSNSIASLSTAIVADQSIHAANKKANNSLKLEYNSCINEFLSMIVANPLGVH